jgi:hypothetical protein
MSNEFARDREIPKSPRRRNKRYQETGETKRKATESYKSIFGEKDVSGFDVSMQNVLTVNMINS